MKIIHFSLLFMLLCCFTAENEFSHDFSDKQVRFCYTISGNSDDLNIKPGAFYIDSVYGGSHLNLIDTMGYGEFFLKVFDAGTNKLIYSKGYCDLFIEWQQTDLAKDSVMSFNESLTFPMPRKPVRVEMYKRDPSNDFYLIFSQKLDPSQLKYYTRDFIRKVGKIHTSGLSSQKLDIVFVSEGYTNIQENKFFKDARRFSDYLFSSTSYVHDSDKINISAVFLPSEEQGVDIPGDSIYVNTVLDAHFGTFGIDRYLTLPDQAKLFQYLAGVACEQVCVLVNSEKYGGGGIYNHYNIFTVDNVKSEQVFLHEFGHGFASLADEYFNAEVPYSSLGSVTVEPYEPNVTALIDFKSKWVGLMSDTIPVPTPDIKMYNGVVGVFEGGKYRSKGYYRPERDCMMRTLEAGHFCRVCDSVIQQMLTFYSN
jgi:hypothetical protein